MKPGKYPCTSSSEVGTIGDVRKQGKEKVEGSLLTSMAVTQDNKELKEGWRDISRPDIKKKKKKKKKKLIKII